MSEQPVPRRYSLGISSIPPVEDTDGEAETDGPEVDEAETEVDEAEVETEPADEEPPEP